jgi:hypothetical protein
VSLKVLWHINPLLGIDGEVGNYTAAISRKRLSKNHVGTPTDTNAKKAQQQKGVFFAIRAEML